VHSFVAVARERMAAGLGLRAAARSLVTRRKPSIRLGAPSRFAEGAWVRVKSEARVRETLDARDRLRGLWFVPAQWAYCDGVYQVSRVVRRMLDDHGTMRAISRTVLLDGPSCGGVHGDAGCGRYCPMMFRDDWLEPAEAPAEAPPPSTGKVRVKSVEAIEATLDRHRRHDGIRFMPEMRDFAGAVVDVDQRVTRVFELDAWRPLTIEAFLLRGLACTGAALGDDGPCHRACPFIWHGDWVEKLA
jgi:hypothetical protein